MSDNIAILPVVSSLHVKADRILRAASEAGLTEIIVIGCNENGDEYFASSVPDGPNAVWQLERAKLKLLRVAD